MSQDRGKDPIDSSTSARQGHNTKTFDSPFKVNPKVDGKRDDLVWHFVAGGRYLDGSTTAGRKSGRRCLCRLCGRSICGGAKAAKEYFSKSEMLCCEAATPAMWNAIWSKDMTKCPKEFASAIEALQSLLPGHSSLQWSPLRFPKDAVPPPVPATAPSGRVASPNSGALAIRVTTTRPATTVATQPAAPPSAPLAATRGARDVEVGRSTPANEPPPVRNSAGSATFDEESTRAFIESRRWGGSVGSSAVLAPVFKGARQSHAAQCGAAVAPGASPHSSSEHPWLPPPPSRAAQRPVVHHTHATALLDPSHAPADGRQSASVPRFGEQADYGVPAKEVPAPVSDSSPTPIPTTTGGGRSAPQPPPLLTRSLDPLQRIRDLAVAQSATPVSPGELVEERVDDNGTSGGRFVLKRLRHGGRRDESIASRVRRRRVQIAIDMGHVTCGRTRLPCQRTRWEILPTRRAVTRFTQRRSFMGSPAPVVGTEEETEFGGPGPLRQGQTWCTTAGALVHSTGVGLEDEESRREPPPHTSDGGPKDGEVAPTPTCGQDREDERPPTGHLVGIDCPLDSLPRTDELFTMDSALASLPDVSLLISPTLPVVAPPEHAGRDDARRDRGFDEFSGDTILHPPHSGTPAIFHVSAMWAVEQGLAEEVARGGPPVAAQRSLGGSLEAASGDFLAQGDHGSQLLTDGVSSVRPPEEGPQREPHRGPAETLEARPPRVIHSDGGEGVSQDTV
ncbi:hypothetical protein CBR_g12652 [Chara braunii]|uniref:Uncharacterized protein n=1 Tax=Chara braunii TaxID=69332 RepID=A0A388KS82_CHABU|nr:hypothetical protein CBR_g12652 [Chara braunii]|eukprot:GBG72930.1 hypothetical protein CBR_g12652 [Chara braunii]